MNYVQAGMGMKLGSRFYSSNARFKGEALHNEQSETLKNIDEDKSNYLEAVDKFVQSDDCQSHYQYLLDNVYGGVDDVEFT